MQEITSMGFLQSKRFMPESKLRNSTHLRRDE